MIIRRQRLYLQKDYSIISDIKSSGVKRTYRKAVGRFRRKTADKINKSIEEDLKKAAEDSFYKNSVPGIINPSAEKDLVEGSNKAVALKLGNTAVNVKNKDAKKLDFDVFKEEFGEEEAKRLKSGIDAGKDLIIYPENGELSALAHEIGHSNTKNKILRKLTKSSETVPGINRTAAKAKDTEKGLLVGAKRYIRTRSLLAEERLANKEGLRLLKKSGIGETGLEDAETRYKLSESNYKHTSDAYSKIPVANKIQIPSRRK